MNLLNFIKNSLYETKEYSDIHNIYEDGDTTTGDTTTNEIRFSNFNTDDVKELYTYIKNGKTANDPEIQNIVNFIRATKLGIISKM